MHGKVQTPEIDPDADGPTIRQAWPALAVLVGALTITSMDHTIINVALPSIARDTGATSSQLQWVVDAYTIVFAALLMVGGNLGDRLGRKRALVIGLAVFGVGASAAAISGSVAGLIVGRTVMGVGGALIMPATLSLLVNIFTTARERAFAIGAWAAAASLGIALGPIVGGWLVETWSWSAVFWINIPLLAAVIVGALHLLPESRDPATTKPDIGGALLSVAAITTLVWTIIEAPENGWSSPTTIGGAALGALLVSLFVGWERRVPTPMLQIDLLRDRRFSGASAALTLTSLALAGAIFTIAQSLQYGLGYSALTAGVALLPAAAGLMVGTHATSHIGRRGGTRAAVTTGIAIAAVGLAVPAVWATAAAYLPIGIGLFLLGLGLGIAMPPATTSIMDALPKSKAGTGSAVNDTVRELGSALGVAILGSALASRYASSLGRSPELRQVPTELRDAVTDNVGSALAMAQELGAPGRGLADSARAAFASGMQLSLWLAVAVAGLAAVVAARHLPGRGPVSDGHERG